MLIRLGRSIPALILLVCISATIPIRAADKTTICEKLAAQFRLLDAKENLYYVDKEYVLQPQFDPDGNLVQIQVVPRYYFESIHAEWREPASPPSMPVDSYLRVFDTLLVVKDLGRLTDQGKVGIILNLKTSLWDQYEEGIVERAIYRRSPQETDSVAWFTVYYLHSVSGKVEAKERTWGGPRVEIGGSWYWVPSSVFNTVEVGENISVRIAGPFSASHGRGSCESRVPEARLSNRPLAGRICAIRSADRSNEARA